MSGAIMDEPPSLFPQPGREKSEKDRVREAGLDPSGHRARLRKRLLDGGDDALGDHEVIEYLLMTAIPRQDVKPHARMLMQRFGSLAGVLNADAQTLMGVPGIKDAAAAALILVHNHPSGSPEPSRADIQITQKIIEAGRLLGITVHDHVIIGRQGHVSLKAKGLI